MEEELSVVFTELPEEDKELLMEMDFPLGVGEVGLGQRVGQQPGQAGQDKLEVLVAVDPRQVVEEEVVPGLH